MKIFSRFIPVFALVLVSQASGAQLDSNSVAVQIIKKEKVVFTVYGNCNMCKQRIEGAIKDLPGIISAEWNVDSKKLTVRFDPEEIMLNEIHKSIASAGHDTEKVRAENDAYESLPGCCKYDRPKS